MRKLVILGAIALLAVTARPSPSEPPNRPDRPHRGHRASGAGDIATLAVLPFSVDPSDTVLAPLGYALPDLLTTDLARSRRLTLVERAQLATVLREQRLASSGIADPQTAPRLGRLLQADRLVTGSLSRQGASTIRFEAHILNVETGRIDTALVATAPMNDVLAAEKEVAFRLFDYLGVNLTPQERALVAQAPTRNVEALVAYGLGVKQEVNGQYAAAVNSFERATRVDAAFRQSLARARGVRAFSTGTATRAMVQRVNRPLESIPTQNIPGMATDPAFPSSRSTIIVTINHP
jgi:TolB-like protein